MCKPKVSVVVPIYNVESYLEQCVDSILAQTLINIEVILVDDGSPDRCGEIADAYAQKDFRVKVIHQKNEGLGSARNAGIGNASGEYIGFVDADDWVKPEMFEGLYKAAKENDADIVVGGHVEQLNGTEHANCWHPLGGHTYSKKSEIKKIRAFLYGRGLDDKNVDPFPMRVWTSIYRMSMIKDAQLRFENIMSEDTIFNLDAYDNANTISFITNNNYCYRIDNYSSITKSFSDETLKKYSTFIGRLKNKALEEKSNDYLERVKRTAVAYSRMYVCALLKSNLKWKSKRKYFFNFVSSDFFLQYSASYPLGSLPMMQRIFQNGLVKQNFVLVMVLMALRSFAKKHKAM